MKKLFAALALLVTVACGVKKAPVVTPQAPPAERYVRFTIRANPLPPDLTAFVYDDTPIRMNCDIVVLDVNGARANCLLDPKIPVGGVGGHITVSGHEYNEFDEPFLLMGALDQELDEVWLVPTFHPLPRLQIVGEFFRLETGQPWTAIEASDFNLFNRFLSGEDIEPILKQRADAGFNLLRVFTAFHVAGIGHLTPREHADYYAKIPAFADAAARHGLYVEFTGFTGPYDAILPTDADKIAHWNHLVDAVANSTNVLLELINEYNNGPNLGVPLDQMRRPTATLASHGSSIVGSLPLQPFWDYATVHWDDPRKIAHDGMSDVADPFHVPALVNETMRFPDNMQSVQLACDSGGGAALLAAGSAFHSVHGKTSELWQEPVELAAAQAWARCAKEVPLIYQRGDYRHRADLEGPDVIRAYSRILAGVGEYVRLIHTK